MRQASRKRGKRRKRKCNRFETEGKGLRGQDVHAPNLTCGTRARMRCESLPAWPAYPIAFDAMALQSKAILWVDDEAELLEPHRLLLADRGYVVQAATNADDALELLRHRIRNRFR